MTSYAKDPVTGHPLFRDTDAPDIKVDPQEASAYAGFVGTRPMGTTAEREAYEYAREGLEWYDTTLDAVFLHDGGGWRLWHKRWTTYTPTVTNISGSPTVSGRYAISSGVVKAKVHLILTAGTSVGLAPLISVPVTALAPTGGAIVGVALYADNTPGTAWLRGDVLLQNTTQVAPLATQVSGGYLSVLFNVSGTTPFTWTTSDTMTLDFSYEAA